MTFLRIYWSYTGDRMPGQGRFHLFELPRTTIFLLSPRTLSGGMQLDERMLAGLEKEIMNAVYKKV